MVAKEHGETNTIDILQEACKGLDIDLQERSSVVEHQEHHSQRNKQIIDDFMNMVKSRSVNTVDLSKVHVKHVIDFEKKPSEAGQSQAKPLSTGPQLISLSKKVEYPGDGDAIKGLLESKQVSPGTKDMFGLTALHKFASWDKPDLIEILLPHLDDKEINIQSSEEGYTALHWCVEMGADQALSVLLQDGRIDRELKDKKGRTAEELAVEMEAIEILHILRA
eukprot:TRINITY_DN6486_c0_g1_i3.p1 TRINITY_DN6486_c0_g1~~TRINITY_DN6486_c0_g1_i3.p1  ORF type:complete len:222 (+),score=45.66 TRINITY_DN6486_c0_g1_i3:209-874(+)